MIVLRSLVFNTLFYLNLIAWMLVALPTLAVDRRVFVGIAAAWARSSFWLLKVVVGLRIELRGTIPPGGLLVASKHQSFLETFAYLTLFKDPAFILKRELMWIPLFGWYLAKLGAIPIDRKAGSRALVEMNRRARAVAASGRQVIIFPEGTRRRPGDPPAYKFGIVHLYESLRVPCLPVALNTGVFWPRRSFLRRSGVLTFEFLEPIPAGLPRAEFAALVQERIETAADRLLEEARIASPGATADALAGS